ncbi:hypothetical protein HDU96_001152 [Phlyctochytrium bullatum]|nr:hypothetical protein HDU96_001152 [Phlyctochytrium bullatum]
MTARTIHDLLPELAHSIALLLHPSDLVSLQSCTTRCRHLFHPWRSATDPEAIKFAEDHLRFRSRGQNANDLLPATLPISYALALVKWKGFNTQTVLALFPEDFTVGEAVYDKGLKLNPRRLGNGALDRQRIETFVGAVLQAGLAEARVDHEEGRTMFRLAVVTDSVGMVRRLLGLSFRVSFFEAVTAAVKKGISLGVSMERVNEVCEDLVSALGFVWGDGGTGAKSLDKVLWSEDARALVEAIAVGEEDGTDDAELLTDDVAARRRLCDRFRMPKYHLADDKDDPDKPSVPKGPKFTMLFQALAYIAFRHQSSNSFTFALEECGERVNFKIPCHPIPIGMTLGNPEAFDAARRILTSPEDHAPLGLPHWVPAVLPIAALHNRWDLVALLLSHTPNAGAHNPTFLGGGTALHHAVAAVRPDMVRLLLEAPGVDPNAIRGDSSQFTPMHVATRIRRAQPSGGDDGPMMEIVRLLLDAGADPDPDGEDCFDQDRRPVMAAARWGYWRTAEVLREAISRKVAAAGGVEN